MPDPSPADPLIGTTVAHYEIAARLGRGAMGVVYEARDTRLGRRVALKFLPAEWGDDASIKQRFLREAQAASATDHPYICTVHGIESTPDGRLFIVMARYEGETLKEKLREGRLEVAEALSIAMQAAEGLAKAHAQGVVHRDIKPGNLMLTEHGVKILDFGLAKVARAAVEEVTVTGSMVGTVAYMSPEQTRMEEADERSDVWSLGVVLYQMLLGELPFRGSHAEAVLYAIRTDPVPPPRARRPGIPEAVERLVLRALRKDPNERLPSARAFARELRQLQGLAVPQDLHTGPVSAPRKSILVLPFTTLSSTGEQDYFADGLTDEIITDLSRLRSLSVISWTSSMRLKQVTDSLRDIAARLNVRYVLEGAVRHSGGSLRVTTKLIDMESDAVAWAERFTGTLEDVFAIQEGIARGIVDALHLMLSPTEAQKLVEHPIDDPRAYDSYLKAKQEMLRFTRDGLDRALAFLRASEQLVGENVLLLSATGQAYWQYVNAGIDANPAYLAKARGCAERLLEIAPQSEHGHRLLGLVEIHEGQAVAGLKRLKRALELDPNNADTLVWLCVFFGISGKAAAAQPWAERLRALDPLTPLYQILPAVLAVSEGRFLHATEIFARHYAANLDNPGVRLAHGQALVLAERPTEALEAFDTLLRDLPDSPFAQLGAAWATALRGDLAEARRLITPAIEDVLGGDAQYSWVLAQACALAGDRPRAMHWLHHAVTLGFINYPLLAQQDPVLAPLRSDEAFAGLLAEVQQRWEAFDV